MPKSVFIESRFWFDRNGGNTYFSNRVWVDGSIAFTTGLEYGYGSQFEYSAINELVKLGLLPADCENKSSWQVQRDTKIHVYVVQSEVGKRQMFLPSPYATTKLVKA